MTVHHCRRVTQSIVVERLGVTRLLLRFVSVLLLLACSSMLNQPLLLGQAVPATDTKPQEIASEPKSSVEPKPFQVRQVFVPESDLSVLGDSFIPTDREKLVDLINNATKANAAIGFMREPIMTEGFYVARLVGQDLVSDASRWTVESTGTEPRMWTVPDTSIAWRPIRGSMRNVTDSDEGAGNVFQFRIDGLAETLVKDSQQTWIGWSARGDSVNNNSLIRFSIQLPSAVRSRILLELPPGWKIVASTSVAAKAGDFNAILPLDWPPDLKRTYNFNNGWLIHVPLDGRAVFTIGKSSDLYALPFLDAINHQRVEYRLTDQGLEFVSKTSVEHFRGSEESSNSSQENFDAVLDVDPRLGISEVTVNGAATSWRSGETANTIIVSLEPQNLLEADRQSQVEVFAIAAWSSENLDLKLPSVHWNNRYVLDGSTTVSLSNDWKANSLRTTLGQLVSASQTIENTNLSRFDFTWQGTPPDVRLHATPVRSLPPLEVVSRLTNTNDGFTTTSRINLSKMYSQSTTIEVEMDEGWVIDSVQALEGATASANVRSSPERLEGGVANSVYDISVSTTVEFDSLPIEIIARKSKFLDNNSTVRSSILGENNLYLDACHPIRFTDFEQKDIYLIESTGRYSIDASPSLVESRIEDSELPVAYRSMLPRLGEFWLIKPPSGLIPRLVFRRQAAPYTAELDSTIRPTNEFGVLETRYQLRCLPVAGAVGNVVVSFSHHESKDLKWLFRTKNPNSPVTWTPVESVKIENQKIVEMEKTDALPSSNIRMESPQRYRLVLPGAISVPFELEAVQQSFVQDPIEFPLTPEAMQVRAKLSLDSTLSMANYSTPAMAESRFQPLGMWQDSAGVEYRRFQYAPSQDLRARVEYTGAISRCWVSKMNTIQHVSTNGDREAEVLLDLYHGMSCDLIVSVSPSWTIRSASIVNSQQPVQLMQSDSKQYPWRLVLPKTDFINHDDSQTTKIRVVMDGPTISMRQQVALNWPSLVPDCEVLSQDFAVKLPRGVSIGLDRKSSARIRTSIEELKKPDVEGRFSLSRWLRSNLFIFVESSDSNIPKTVAGTTDEYLQIHENSSAWQWFTVVVGFVITLWLAKNSTRGLWLAIGTLLIGLAIAPDTLVDWIQSLLIATSLSTVFWVSKKMSALRSDPTLNSISKITVEVVEAGPKAGVMSVVFLLAIAGSFALGEEVGSDSNAVATDLEPLHSVVFPIDELGNLSGDIAYVGEQFLKSLNRKQSLPSRPNYLVSAMHQVVIDGGPEGKSTSPSCVVTSVYEWNIQEANNIVQIPIATENVSAISMLADGNNPVAVTVNPASSLLDWLPRKAGRVALKVSFRYEPTMDLKSVATIRFPVIPIASATVDIMGEDVVDLQSNAAGQVTNPNVGRFVVSLGRRPEIILNWRQSQPRLSSKTSMAGVSIEWAAFCDRSIAKCNVDLTGYFLDQNYLELEFEQIWEPVGFDWGDAKVIEVTAGSTNLKKRFRVQWKVPSDVSRRNLRFFLRTTVDPQSSRISLPSFDIGGARVDSRTVTVAQEMSCLWVVNYGNTWEPVNFTSKFEWLSAGLGGFRTLTTQDASATLTIQKPETLKKSVVSVGTSLLFGSGSALGRADFFFESLGQQPSDFIFIATPGIKVQSIKIDSESVSFIESELSGGHRRVQVFLEPSKLLSKPLRINFQQLYSSSDAWQSIPLVLLSNADIRSCHVAASGLLEIPIEFAGISEQIERVSSASSGSQLPSGRVEADKANAITDPILSVDLPFDLFQRELTIEKDDDSDGSKRDMYSPLWAIDLQGLAFSEEDKRRERGGLQSDSLESVSLESDSLRYRITASVPELEGLVVSALSVDNATWTCRVFGSVSRNGANLGGLLLDVPVGITASVVSKNRLTQFDSPEAGRRLLLVSQDPPVGVAQQGVDSRLDFSIDFIFGQDQSSVGISVPVIRVLNGGAVEQWIAVPRSSASQDFVWTTSGVRVSRQLPTNPFLEPILREELIWYVPVSQQPEVRLNNLENRTSNTNVACTFHRVDRQSATIAKLESFFVLDPQGVSQCTLRIPARSKLIALYVNDHVAAFKDLDDQGLSPKSIDFLLQSSVFTQFIRAVFEVPVYSVESHESAQSLDLPSLASLTPAKVFLATDEGLRVGLHNTDIFHWEVLPTDNLNRELLLGSLLHSDRLGDAAIDASVPLRSLWWESWHAFSSRLLFPSRHRVETKATDDWLAERDNLVAKWRFKKLGLGKWLGVPNWDVLSAVPECKTYVCSKTSTSKASKPSDDSMKTQSDGSSVHSVEHTGPSVSLTIPVTKTLSQLRYSIACLTIGFLIIIGAFLTSFRERTSMYSIAIFKYMQDRPWTFFAVLGVVLSGVLYTSWAGPGCLAIASVLVLRQFFFQPYTISNLLVLSSK